MKTVCLSDTDYKYILDLLILHKIELNQSIYDFQELFNNSADFSESFSREFHSVERAIYYFKRYSISG